MRLFPNKYFEDALQFILIVVLVLFIVLSLYLRNREEPYVPCETDNVEQEVYYGRDGDSRLVCWVTEWDEETGINWVMKFEVIEEEPTE